MSNTTQALTVKESASVGLEESRCGIILNTPFEGIVRSINSGKQTKAEIEQNRRMEELPKLKLVARILDVYYFLSIDIGMPYREISVEEFLSTELVLKRRNNKLFRRLFRCIGAILDFILSGDNSFHPVHYALQNDLETHLYYSKHRQHYPPNLEELLEELPKRLTENTEQEERK